MSGVEKQQSVVCACRESREVRQICQYYNVVMPLCYSGGEGAFIMAEPREGGEEEHRLAHPVLLGGGLRRLADRLPEPARALAGAFGRRDITGGLAPRPARARGAPAPPAASQAGLASRIGRWRASLDDGT